jgi:carboxypeptidase PM20D1
MEAVEMLVKNGFQPERTIYLAFGHDEEVGGLGAQTIVEALQARKIELEMVVDEGGLISKGSIPGIQQEVALIGTAEKGYCSVELTVKGEGGHSSMPPPQTAVGVLSAAIQRLEANQMPARIAGATRQMLDFIAADAPFFLRLLFSNLWISEPLLRSQFVKSNSGNAALRTTTAATVFNAGIKDNVIPTQAKAVVNFRIIPGETIEDVLAHVKRTINDPRIAVAQSKSQMGQNPSPVSPTDHPSFQTLHQSIREVFPDVLVAPYLVVGATDSRRFIPICKNIYRFMPIRIASEDLKRVHGTNERVKVDCVVESVQFYARLIENLNGLK